MRFFVLLEIRAFAKCCQIHVCTGLPVLASYGSMKGANRHTSMCPSQNVPHRNVEETNLENSAQEASPRRAPVAVFRDQQPQLTQNAMLAAQVPTGPAAMPLTSGMITSSLVPVSAAVANHRLLMCCTVFH